jgi:hypothetical protein
MRTKIYVHVNSVKTNTRISTMYVGGQMQLDGKGRRQSVHSLSSTVTAAAAIAEPELLLQILGILLGGTGDKHAVLVLFQRQRVLALISAAAATRSLERGHTARGCCGRAPPLGHAAGGARTSGAYSRYFKSR